VKIFKGLFDLMSGEVLEISSAFSISKHQLVKGRIARVGTGYSYQIPSFVFTIENSNEIFRINSGSINHDVALSKPGDEIEFYHKKGWIAQADILNHTVRTELGITEIDYGSRFNKSIVPITENEI
jgi:hypothetical protein